MPNTSSGRTFHNANERIPGAPAHFIQGSRQGFTPFVLSPVAALAMFRTEAEAIQAEARALIKRAAEAGLVLTIEQQSVEPFAMGRYVSLASVRPARGRY